MAHPTGIEEPDLNDSQLEKRLLDNASTYTFFQAVRILRRIVKNRGLDPKSAIRIRPALSMNRPRSSIVSIRKLEVDTSQGSPAGALTVAAPLYEIETSFLGLYGASSPLPNFYTEDLIYANQEDQDGARQLLDIFHQRIYQLYMDSLEKYRPLFELTEQDPGSQFLSVLWSVVGLREDRIRRQFPDPHIFLRYILLFASRQRSATGLQSMLEDFTGYQVTVEQCIERLLHVPKRHRLCLGVNAHNLGENSLVGDSAVEYTGKILIVIGPVPHKVFSELVSDKAKWPMLIALIKYYLKTPVECDLAIKLNTSDASPLQLGNERWAKLGLNSWVHHQHQGKGNDVPELTSKISIN